MITGKELYQETKNVLEQQSYS